MSENVKKSKIISFIVTNSEILLSLLLMLVAVIISFPTHSHTEPGKVLGIFSKTQKFTAVIKPGLRSSLYGVFFFFSFVVRCYGKNILDKSNKIPFYAWIIAVLDVLFLASFLNVLVSSDSVKIFGTTMKFSYQEILGIAIVCSWLGIGAVAGLSWIFIFISGIIQLFTIDKAMGSAGIAYIMCSIISIILQLRIAGITDLSAFASGFLLVSQKVKGDAVEGVQATKKVVETAAKVAVSAATGAITAATGVINDTEPENE